MKSNFVQAEKIHDLDSREAANQNSKCKKSGIMMLTILCCLGIVAGIVVLILFVVNEDSSDSSGDCNDRCTANYTQYIANISRDSKNWTAGNMTDYLKGFQSTALGKCIMKMNQTNYHEMRPDPSCYLPSNVIKHHLDMFRVSGASAISSTKFAYLYGDFATIGYGPDKVNLNGDQWVSPFPEQSSLLTKCSTGSDPGDCVLTALGIKPGKWDMFTYDWGNPSYPNKSNKTTIINRVMQVHILFSSMDDLNLRIPSGNEEGVINGLWVPGGYTINGTAEAIIDRINEGQYCWKPVTTPNGTFCYPDCEVVCAGNSGCLETFC